MLARQVLALALCALLIACGSARKSNDDSFDKNFQERFVPSCITSATNSGVAQELAGKVCTCASDKVVERFTVQQKMHLTEDQLRPILLECKRQVPAG